MYLFGTKDIKHYITKLFRDRTLAVQGKDVLDVPAGNGVSTKLIIEAGGRVTAGDLIPSFFRVPDVECKFMDLGQTLPCADESFDFVLCQEGIEHISDQIALFKEFSRILKRNGHLVVTTPNYSNIRAKLSYLFNESELMGKIMPPNEVDSIWFAPENNDNIYYGHLNLIGVQRLRLFAKLAGFDLLKLHSNRVNYTSLLFFPVMYPVILLFSYLAYRRMKRKKGAVAAKAVEESFLLSISPAVLLQGHIVAEFVKTKKTFVSPIAQSLEKQATSFIT